jgi:hypothetical protein
MLLGTLQKVPQACVTSSRGQHSVTAEDDKQHLHHSTYLVRSKRSSFDVNWSISTMIITQSWQAHNSILN